MKILYLGDVMGEPGMALVERLLPELKRQNSVDFVIAQAENLSDGKGIRLADFARLRRAGVDFCTGGNHTLAREETLQLLNDPAQPIIRPANYPAGTPGMGYKYAQSSKGEVLVISLLGQIVGKDANMRMDNPLIIIDLILQAEKEHPRVATIVNFHGDFSSEKKIIGHYLDGRVTAVVGDHWHTQTADVDVLNGGTAHITDVGMCGSLDSSLGVTYDSLVLRWREDYQTRNVLETKGRMQLNALLVDVDEQTGLATEAVSVRQVR
ncbi:MAG: TIGR00282 family metallophosphoesterase [Candidatus Saccharimonadales bacterium]